MHRVSHCTCRAYGLGRVTRGPMAHRVCRAFRGEAGPLKGTMRRRHATCLAAERDEVVFMRGPAKGCELTL